METSAALLVPAKLTAPQLNPLWVPRERLLARLDAGLGARLTLVVAPAGFGKSTLVAQWLLEAQRAQRAARSVTELGVVAWLTLDEYDQDGLRFLAYVVGAIERVAPAALPTIGGLLASAERPPLYVLLQALLVDLNGLRAGLTLVLDDYHAITAEPIHQAVAYLLRHLPPTSRLVILSRTDPPISLARLRADLQLVEVRAQELRFTDAEARALVATFLGEATSAPLVAALQQKTEGWAIALQLAALAALEAPHTVPPRPAAGGIAEYLAEEVFERQPAQMQAVLLLLAVPERLCVGLAATLLDTPDDLIRVEDLLAQVVRANLLLVPIDAEARWYRFHHLFRDLLLRRLHLTLGPRRHAALQLRAAGWLEREGLFEEAVRCYLAAGEADRAGGLIERLLAPDFGLSLRPMRPSHWLRLLPDALIARRPGLALLEARIGFATLNIPVLAAHLARVEALLAEPELAALPPPWPTFPADLALLHAVLAYMQGQLDDALTALEATLNREHGLGLTGQATMVLGRAYVAAGRYDEGVRKIETRRTALLAQHGLAGELSCSIALCSMHGLGGSLEALRIEAERLSRTVAAIQAGDYWMCYAETNLGRVAYERSDLVAAARHFAAVAERRYQTHAAVTIGALTALALIAARQGSPGLAARYVEEARALAVEVGSPFARNEAAGCAVQLALLRGDLPAALRAAEEIALDPYLGTSSWHATNLPQLSKALALIGLGADDALTRAEALVAAVLAQVRAQHNTRPLVCALSTLALLRQAQARPGEALEALEQALSIAAPCGYLRVFADFGPDLRPLLRALADQGAQPAYVARILTMFEPSAPLAPVPTMIEVARGGLEALTNRELEILALLEARWSDKEIAERLVITPNTVRKHTSTVYGKLGVNSRREAVEAARALGLLPRARSVG